MGQIEAEKTESIPLIWSQAVQQILTRTGKKFRSVLACGCMSARSFVFRMSSVRSLTTCCGQRGRYGTLFPQRTLKTHLPITRIRACRALVFSCTFLIVRMMGHGAVSPSPALQRPRHDRHTCFLLAHNDDIFMRHQRLRNGAGPDCLVLTV